MPKNRNPRRPNHPNPSQQAIAAASLQVTASSYSGPLPHPDILRQYEEIMPGMVDRVVAMAEKQTDHRIDIESYAIKSDARRANWGLVAGLIVALAFVAGAVYLIDGGHSTQGLVIGLVPTGTLAGAFIYANNSRKNEREQRMRILMGQQPQPRR